MSLTDIDYAARAHNAGLNVYFAAEGDRDGNIRSQTVNPANPCCNCYSIAKAFTVTAVGMLYDRGLMRPGDIAVDFIPEMRTEHANHDLGVKIFGFVHSAEIGAEPEGFQTVVVIVGDRLRLDISFKGKFFGDIRCKCVHGKGKSDGSSCFENVLHFNSLKRRVKFIKKGRLWGGNGIF